jgi:site-specific DNA-methyltransferase (adenine-specific)
MPGDLYYGDNLEILRHKVASESVDLIYLDPPFNSDRTYNLIHKGSQAQERAFVDTWTWDDASDRAYAELTGHAPTSVMVPRGLTDMMVALRGFLWKDHRNTLAYLSMMAIRIIEMRRVLRATGSLYLHCDPTASHYLKIVLDAVFGPENFFGEIVWKRYGAHGDAKRYGAVHDVILFYGKTRDAAFHKQFIQYSDEYAESRFRHVDESGRRYQEQNLSSPNPRPNLMYPYTASNGITYQPHENGWKCEPGRMRQLDAEGRLHFPKTAHGRLRLKMYLDESEGVPVQDVWTDILLPSTSKERTGYQTQKPLALLERIIKSSSAVGDLILDPFCGCGTTVEASEALGRKWIGVDVAIRAVDVIKERLDARFGKGVWREHGEPTDADSAAHLAESNAYDFQWWAVRKIGGQPPKGEKKKGGDGGIDGEITVRDFDSDKRRRVIVSVKGGRTLTPDFVKALKTTVDMERADYGVLLTMHEPTAGMRNVARDCGTVPWATAADGKLGHRIRIVTVPELFAGTFQLPGRNETPRTWSSPPPAEVRPGDNLSLPFPAKAPKPKPSKPGTAKAKPARQQPAKAYPKIAEPERRAVAESVKPPKR